MSIDIEQLLIDLDFSYTKQVRPESVDRFDIPFDLEGYPLSISAYLSEGMLHLDCCLRCLDSLSVRTGVRNLLRDLLRANSHYGCARVFLSILDDEDESEWIAITSAVPSESLSAEQLRGVLFDTAALAGQVMTVIEQNTLAREPQVE